MNPSKKIAILRSLNTLFRAPSQGGKPLLLLIFLGATALTASAWMWPFSKERIKAEGQNCVHGFEGNFGEIGIFYAGKTPDLNQHLRSLEGDNQSFRKVIILHPGSNVLPNYLKSDPETTVNWQVSHFLKLEGSQGIEDKVEPDGSVSNGFHLQIDIWLGGSIKLDELEIPQGFEVQSGKEIENFVAQYQQQKKKSEASEPEASSAEPDKQ